MAESPSAVPGRIFISYRREETGYPAGWLFDRLGARFGGGQVFKDVDSIELGDDFVEVITTAVGSCDVLLALIGDRWLTITDEDGRRRIDNPDDFMRLEIEAALARKVRVIPVLVDGARMPRADELPPTLAALARRHALELSPSRFDFDASRLLKVLDKTFAEVQARPSGSESEPLLNTPDPSTAELRKAPEQREHVSASRRPGVPPATTDTAGGPPSPAGSRKPPSKQRRRLSKRAQILAGVGAGVLVLIPLLIVALGSNSHPQVRQSPPIHRAVIFQDDFSSRAHAWDDAGGKLNGGHYTKGAYRIYTRWAKDHFSEQGFPRDAISVFPSAPRDLRVEVVARRLLGGDQDAGYGIACRANMSSQSFYQFAIWRDQAVIAKLTPKPPYYTELESKDISAVHPNGRNRMQAMCTTDEAQDVHLAFWVNGKPVASAIDRDRPLLTGTVGLLVATGSDAKAIEAEFDDFVVTPA